jgi:hypothetical protein
LKLSDPLQFRLRSAAWKDCLHSNSVHDLKCAAYKQVNARNVADILCLRTKDQFAIARLLGHAADRRYRDRRGAIAKHKIVDAKIPARYVFGQGENGDCCREDQRVTCTSVKSRGTTRPTGDTRSIKSFKPQDDLRRDWASGCSLFRGSGTPISRAPFKDRRTHQGGEQNYLATSCHTSIQPRSLTSRVRTKNARMKLYQKRRRVPTVD